MTRVESIASALVEECGFVPLEKTDCKASLLVGRDSYAFVGMRDYWGSIMSCAILPVAGEDELTVSQRAAEFYAFSSGFKEHAASAGLIKLGAFGLLAIVADRPTSEKFRRWVTSQKRGSAWRQDYCVVWLLDLSLHEVFRHRGFPLLFYPGADFFRRILKDEGTG